MENLMKWKSGLRIKLLTIGFIPLLLLILISFWSTSKLDYLQDKAIEDYNNQSELIRLSGQLSTSVNAMGRWIWLSYSTRQKSEDRKKYISFARKEIEKFDSAAALFLPLKKSQEINDHFISSTLEKWKKAKKGVLEGLLLLEKDNESDQEQSRDYILKTSTPYLVPITSELQDMVVKIKETTNAETNIQKEKINTALKILFLVTALASLSIILLTTGLALKLVNHFSKLSESMTMTSNEVGNTSAHMASVSFELSATATSQASALEQISSSLEEVTAMVGKNTSNAKKSADDAKDATLKAKDGQIVMDNLLSSIEEINESNKSIINQVNEGNEKFNSIITLIKEIEQKTSVINDIVFQTKLLSFNASVEAARAGENGKGFSVVAEEVGKLAEMSGKASTEISTMLSSSIGQVEKIIIETKNNVGKSVDEGKRKVEAGLQIARDCKNVLSEITTTIETASIVATDIREASQEQALGVDEILKAVNQLDHVSNKNTQTSVLASQTARELEKYASELNRDVTTFMHSVEGSAMKITRFRWNEKLILNVSAMDHQHQGLVEKMDLFFVYLDNNDLGKSKTAFSELATATVAHFESEEKFLESIQYPNLTSHKRIHQDLVNRVMEYAKQLENGKINKYEVADFLKNWLSLHIMGQDQHYSRYYHSK